MTRQLYFLGIGGIGMSALARWFHAQGATVAGYDRTSTALTQALESEGIEVSYKGDVAALPAALQADISSGQNDRWTIVWTPAIPRDFALITALTEAGFNLHKRAEILGELSRERPLLAVAGTHGKTTTSTLLAHLLAHASLPVEAFLGGIALGQGSNLLLAGKGHPRPWMVAEADEFDRSFLTLHPQYAAITSIDADHLDIYGTHASMLAAFAAFAGQVKPGGLLLHADTASAISEAAVETLSHSTYGALPAGASMEALGLAAAYSTVDRNPTPSSTTGLAQFTLHLQGHPPMLVQWNMPGAHNAANATAAAHLAVCAGMSPAAIPAALAAFPGVARRFEIKHHQGQKAIIDDYAHHPREIEGAIAAARLAFPNQPITGVFQPHLFSRTQDFMESFARALSALDACILLPIYPARELPIPGVDAQGIGEKMVGCPVECPPESRFLDVLEKMDPTVLLFMGAGDLNQWIEPAWDRMNPAKTTPTINTP
ncbi:MAG: UDP-N-acetylmuramate--L-alanine ligase [Flavobacteriales bacterium]|nr:UDP-N-acetylmuramate--L-alanine ligase [Flavobacteriales bacterium]